MRPCQRTPLSTFRKRKRLGQAAFCFACLKTCVARLSWQRSRRASWQLTAMFAEKLETVEPRGRRGSTARELQRRKKIVAGEGKKSKKFWAPHPSGPNPFGPQPFWPPNPSGPQPFGPPPLRAPNPSGPQPFGPPPLRAPNPSGPTTRPAHHPTKKKRPNAVWPNSVKQNWPNLAK